MLAAVKNRDFAVVQWLQGYSSNSGLSYRVLDEAAASGAFAIAQWLVDQRPPRSLSCSGRGVSSVAKRGDLSMLKWLEEFCVGGFPAAAIDLAASAGHLEIVEWMHARNYECTNMAMSGAAANGYMAVVKWLHGNRTEGCTRRAMDGAAERGALEIVQWLHEHRQEGCSAAAMDGAAANGHLTVVQWLHENRTEGCSVNAMNDAAWNGHLHVVQWLHEHRAEGCTNKALQFAVASGHLSVVQFLVENWTEGDHRLAALRATSSGHLEMLQYLLQSCPEFTFRHEDLLGLARRSKHPTMARSRVTRSDNIGFHPIGSVQVTFYQSQTTISRLSDQSGCFIQILLLTPEDAMATSGDENARLNHAPPAPQDAATTKRQRVLDAKMSSQAADRVFDVEMLLRGLLTLLDVASLASFLEVLALDETWQGVLTNEKLWKEMVDKHFFGNLPPIEQFNDEEEVEEEDDDEGDDDLPVELEDEEEEEEEEEEVPDLVEIVEGDVEVEDDVSLVGDEDEDSDQEVVFVPGPRAVRSARQITAEIDTRVVDSLQWVAGVPSQKLLEVACPALKGFLRSAEQLVQFDQRVQIVRGDIGDIETVGDQRVDGLAFPTASFLRNPHTGAAAVIFRRAGQGLNDHVRTLDVRLDIGQAHVTPGFDAGVEKLIHCVGPSGFNPGCMRDLQRTYRSVLRCIQRENLSCVAMASISTGNMGVPVDNAAWYALCAIQRFMRSTDWTATLAIVCFEASVYDAFTKSKAKLLTLFNAEIVRATPPLRQR